METKTRPMARFCFHVCITALTSHLVGVTCNISTAMPVFLDRHHNSKGVSYG
jgi:hypothetical protein